MSETWETIISSPTPKAWIDRALDSLEILLIDHAHCEKKAATSAISLIHKYPHYDLAKYLSPLAREELLHFEQVLRLIKRHDFQYKNLNLASMQRLFMIPLQIKNQINSKIL